MASDDLQAKANLECCRLEAQHDVWKHAFGNHLVFAPLVDSTQAIRVLDSAGANGYWLRDFQRTLQMSVREHPESTFISADINPMMFPGGSQRNANIEHLQHSFLDPWPDHLHDSFDLVHQRLAIAASGKAPIVDTVKRFASLLKPGSGWLQLVELDTSPDPAQTDDHLATEDFKHLLYTVSTFTGIRPYFADGLAGDLRDVGLVDVQEKRIPVQWGRAIEGNEGLLERSVAFPSLPFFADTFRGIAEKMGLSDKRFDQLSGRLEKQLLDKGVVLHAIIVWGRRPA